MSEIDVCFTPAQIHLFDISDKIVVIIDVLRATSTINTALEFGSKKVIPVETIEEGIEYKKKGFIVGAERNGKKYEGFNFGNSPLQYMEDLKGETVVLTTSNGTRAIKLAKDAYKVVTGSFLNLTALCNWLREQNNDVLLLCSGWKDRFSIEDTLLAGAIINRLDEDLMITSDSAFTAHHLYNSYENDLMTVIKSSSHYQRLAHNGVMKDIEYCMSLDKHSTIPIWEKDGMVVMNN